jgi:aldehyde dehydrogenase (NAD+)
LLLFFKKEALAFLLLSSFFTVMINEIFTKQSARALELRTSTAADRIEKLRKLETALRQFEPQLLTALWEDLHKSEFEGRLTETGTVFAEIKHSIKHLAGWMAPKRVPGSVAMMGTVASVRYEPRGVCLVIAPWNYPVNLLLVPLVSAIAAGNTVVLKPSELAPTVAAVMAEMIAATFDEAEVALVEGDAAVSTALLAKPFDHIFFTGSPEVGKIVMAAAAQHLSSVTLELGGKSPVIVDESAHIEKAAARVAWGKFINAGQTCIAPDYALVHESVREAFIAALGRAVANMYGADPAQSPDYCRIINRRHLARVQGLLAGAGTIVIGGTVDAGQNYIAPTVVTEVPAGAEIRREEIFGPVLPVFTYRDVSEAVDYVNRDCKPLALYVFAQNQAVIDQVLRQTSSGGVGVNAVVLQFSHPNLPFGGVRRSGFGAAHGLFGFKAFSHERAVLRDRFMSFSLVPPPYKGWRHEVMRKVQRYLQ